MIYIALNKTVMMIIRLAYIHIMFVIKHVEPRVGQNLTNIDLNQIFCLHLFILIIVVHKHNKALKGFR